MAIDKELKSIFDNLNSEDDEIMIDKLFDYCNNRGISDEEVMKLFDEYLDEKFPNIKNKKMKAMQCGSGISSVIGWSKRPDYKVVLQNY